MNRMMKARPVSKSSLHLDIHDAPAADHFCKMPIKKFTAVWGNVTFCLWSWPPSEYFQKWENFVVELCHLWCFSSRKQQTINRRLDYLEAFKMKRPVVYFDPFKPPFLMVHYCATCCLFFWCMDGRAVTIWNPTQAILCKGLEGSLSLKEKGNHLVKCLWDCRLEKGL